MTVILRTAANRMCSNDPSPTQTSTQLKCQAVHKLIPANLDEQKQHFKEKWASIFQMTLIVDSHFFKHFN